MTIEIDQSGKIENTNQDTVIAFTNQISKSLLIKAKDKREIQKIFRQIGKSRIFIYRTFAILIFLLIKNYLARIDQIIIDDEYPGWGSQIKDYLLTEIRKTKPNFEAANINFNRIGKKSKVHLLGYAVYRNREKPDLEVGYKEILKLIVK